jgi:hypothetical protein
MLARRALYLNHFFDFYPHVVRNAGYLSRLPLSSGGTSSEARAAAQQRKYFFAPRHSL